MNYIWVCYLPQTTTSTYLPTYHKPTDPPMCAFVILLIELKPSRRNMLSRLRALRLMLMRRRRSRGLTRSTLYHMLRNLIVLKMWDIHAFVAMADAINDVYSTVADIQRLCTISSMSIVRYLVGYSSDKTFAKKLNNAFLTPPHLAY